MARILEATQQFLLDRCGDAIAIIDARRPDWPLLVANRAFRALFPSLPAAEDQWLHTVAAQVPGRDLRGALHQALDGDNMVTWDAAAPPGPARDEQTHRRWQFSPIRDDDGTTSQIVLVVTETTPSRRQGDELGAVIDALPLGIIIVDRAGQIERANAAVGQLLGLSSSARERSLGEIFGALALRHENGEPFDPARSLLAPALRGEHRPALYLRFGVAEQDRQERVLAATATPLPNADPTPDGAIIVLRDVSDQKREEAEKDSFLSLISHEIKSPLTSIKGFAQLALRAIEIEADPLPRTKKHLRVIEQQAGRIGHLIGDIADVSRLQRGNLPLDATLFDLVAIARTVVEQQAAAIHSHQVTLDAPDTPLIVRADPRRVQQIAENLITNAAKYSPRADTVAVQIAHIGSFARLRVQDWGIGISDDDQARIFDRFYRAGGGSASGLGLGLYIAHEIAGLSGGALTVESRLGQGSIFRLDLPLATPDPGDD